MPHGLVFNRIYIDGRQNTIGQVVQRAITIDVRLAETTLTMADFAAPEAEMAARGAVFQLFLQAGFDQLVLCWSRQNYIPEFTVRQ